MTQRQNIIEIINTLPDDSLGELASFVDYLRYKSNEQLQKRANTNFLLSIAALGSSGDNNISECQEEILTREIDSIGGWSLHTNE